MTSQDLINLEFLHRATDPRTPESERSTLLESLSFAMANEQEFPVWILKAVGSIESQPIPDQIALWLADQIESSSEEKLGRDILEFYSRLWFNTSGTLAKTRAFEVLLSVEASATDGITPDLFLVTRLLSAEIKASADGEYHSDILSLVDVILNSSRPDLLKVVAQAGGEQGLEGVMSAIREHISRRFALLPLEVRTVAMAFFG